MKQLIAADPYPDLDAGKLPGVGRGNWPCQWITCPLEGYSPFVAAYRRCFTLGLAAAMRAHVSADERYELYLDGARIGRGSGRCWTVISMP